MRCEIDFWTPIRTFGPNNSATTIDKFPPVPGEVCVNNDDDYALQVAPWVPVSGLSGQDRYDGPIFHPSEVIAGPVMEWMTQNPAQYVVVPVENEDDPEDLVGWMLLQHIPKHDPIQE